MNRHLTKKTPEHRGTVSVVRDVVQRYILRGLRTAGKPRPDREQRTRSKRVDQVSSSIPNEIIHLIIEKD